MTGNIEKTEKRFKAGKFKTMKSYYHSKNALYRRHLRRNPTKAELIFKDYVQKELKHPISFQKGFIVPFSRIVDFYFTRYNLIIEIDGHSHNKEKNKDNIKDERFLKERGMKTLRITNEEVFNGTFKEKYINFIKELDNPCG